MPSFLLFSTFFILLLRVCSIHSQANVFDVTLFENISDETLDITEALKSAWNEACDTENGLVVVPYGTFLLNSVTLAGPCNGPTTFVVNGDLKAPTNPSRMNSEDWVLFDDIVGLSVIGNGSFDGQGRKAWHKNECKRKLNCKSLPTSIILKNVTDALIQGIASINSKMFHITIRNSESIIIDNVIIQAPDDSPNTDGIHISRSNDVTIYNTNIGTGDDCISLSQGSTNIFIYNVTCGPGHGISVGSLGRHKHEEDVSGIIVKNCTFTNTTNGARIKTWAPSFRSRVFNLTFQDIILNNVRNPILIDQHYCPNSHCKKKGASDVRISHVQFLNFMGTSSHMVAVTLNCSSVAPCGTDIVLADLDINYNHGGPTTAVCTNFHGIFYECKSPIACVGEIAPAPAPDGGVEIAPTPGGGVEIVPTPDGGDEIVPTPSDGDEIAPTPSDGDEIAPTPSDGDEIAPTPSGGVEIAPTPSGGDEIAPTPSGGVEIAPTPSGGVEIAPTPSGEDEIVPTPSGGDEIVPTLSGGVEIVPTPSGGVEIAPTPRHGDEIAPTSSDGVEIAPIPSSGVVEIVPTSSGGAKTAPTPGSGVIELAPTSSGGLEIAPTLSDKVEIAPTPCGRVEMALTPNDKVKIVPSTNSKIKITTIPSGKIDVIPYLDGELDIFQF